MKEIANIVSRRTAHALMSYNGKGLLISELDDDVEISLEEVKEQRRMAQELTGGEPYVILAIAGKRTSATKEAREYSSKNIPEGRLAEAIIIKSISVRLMGKVFINFHKPGIPTQLFETKEEAMNWLKERLFEAGQ